MRWLDEMMKRMKQTIPLTEDDNVPIEQKTKKVSCRLTKKLTKDKPLLENNQSLSPTKTNNQRHS